VIAGFWNQMPERIPIHWNIRGEIDGWASKSFGLLITPLIGFLAVALCHVVSWLDPKLRANLDKTDRMNKVLQILRLAFAAFFDAVFGVQLAVAFGSQNRRRASASLVPPSPLRDLGQLPAQFATKLFCRHPDALDT
jgi:Protein of unknown function (DUF1648)